MQNIIYEYEFITNEELKNHIIDTKELHKYFTLDWKDLKASKYCGILNFESQDFYILPKISNHNNEKDAEQNLNIFIYMLMYAYDVRLSNEQLASCANQKHSILEVFVQMFASNLLSELKKGLYKEYILEQDNLPVLKGKYLINENLKYNFIRNRIYCEYDDFTPNNSLNQFFLYGLKYLQKFVKDKKLLKQCELIFDEVEYRQFDINKLENIHFNRQNQRFKKSFEIAILLLKQLIPNFSKDKKSFAFLFDMNVLFEKFIARIFKELNNSAKIQNKNSFGDLTLKPDIILNNQIIDTKYKKLNNIDDIKQSDKLQAFAYGINYNVKNVMLLYPTYKDDIDDKIILGKESIVNLSIKTIDLGFSGNNFEDYIEKIKNRTKDRL
ncbi:McrC family protein [Aliarcobacter lanthieri]|uniref:McrC family protein n=1 Tax=Aliarcobacter lanthieri TaxID=1355374 RepID=UPI0004792BE7|nr:restriction endonuclease [Aliarcobacter lanthieri]QKF59067.1 type IV methyl-directed restriction system, component McrC [Aliarcobacter lanthieri]